MRIRAPRRRSSHPPHYGSASDPGLDAPKGLVTRRASDILDSNIAAFILLSRANFDFNMAAERGQKAHEPLKRDLGEFASQDFGEFGLSGSNPLRSDPLRQPERPDCLVQAEHELSLHVMTFGVRESQL
jgi:hypothetical protein